MECAWHVPGIAKKPVWLEGAVSKGKIVGDPIKEVRWRVGGLVDHGKGFDFGEPLETFEPRNDMV